MSPQRRGCECQGKMMDQSHRKVDSSPGPAGCQLRDCGQVILPPWGTCTYTLRHCPGYLDIHQEEHSGPPQSSQFMDLYSGRPPGCHDERKSKRQLAFSPPELCQVFCYENLERPSLPTRFFSPTLCLPQRPLRHAIFSSQG